MALALDWAVPQVERSMLLRLVELKHVGLLMTTCCWLLAAPLWRTAERRFRQREAVIKCAVAAAQHGLGGCAFFVPVERVGEGDARRPVVVVRDVVLRFPADAGRSREVVVDLPVVLKEKRRIEDVGDGRQRAGGVGELVGQCALLGIERAGGGNLCECFVVRQIGEQLLIGGGGSEAERPIEIRIGRVGVAIVAQPRAEFDCMRAGGHGGLVPQLVMILVIVGHLAVRAAAREVAWHAHLRSIAHRSVVAGVAQVLETRLVHDVIVDRFGVADLQRVFVGGGTGGLRGQIGC